MKNEVEAKLVLSARDRTAKAFATVEARIKKAERLAEQVNRKERQMARYRQAEQKASRFARMEQAVANNGVVAAGVGKLGGALGGALAGMGAASAITSYAKLEREMTRVGLAAGATMDETHAATATVAQMAQDLALPLDQAYAGLESLVATGKSLPEALDFLPAILRTAQASGAATDEMSASAAALATSLKVSAAEMQAAFDQLVVGGELGQFELKDMARYLPSLTASASKLGYAGLEGNKRLVAMLQVVRQVSGTSEEAATATRDAFEKMLSPTVAKAMSERGINVGKILERSARQGVNGFEAVIDVLRDTTDQMSDTQRDIYLSSIFTEADSRRAVTAMLRHADAYKRYMNELGNAAGATERNLKAVLDNTQASVDRLSNSWDKLVNSVGAGLDAAGASTFMDNLSGAIDLATGLATSEEKRREFALVQSQTGHRNKIAGATDRIFQTERDILDAEDNLANMPNPAREMGMHLMEQSRLEQLEGQLKQSYEDRAVAVAAAQWDAIDRGYTVGLPRWMQGQPEAPTGRKGGVPFPQPDPRRLPPQMPDITKAFPATGLPAGDIAHPGWSDSNAGLAIPAEPAWTPATTFDNPLSGSADINALRDAMDAAGSGVRDGGREAADEVRAAIREGSQMLSQAAQELKQGLRDGAAAVSAAKVQVQAAPGRAISSRPNANLGETMPDAGIPGR